VSDVRDVLRALAREDASVVLVGGVALQLHGSAYVTYDIDIGYERTRENATRIVRALAPFHPRPREFPAEIPFIFDAQALLSNEILMLASDAADIYLLGKIKGIGGFREVDALAEEMAFEQFKVRVLSIDGLIAAKRATGRKKDESGLLELEAIREARIAAEEESIPKSDANP
jgi:predicted nucleotidyltransferase